MPGSSEQDPIAHEQECMRAVLKTLADLPLNTTLHEVRLEGEPPETCLIVEVSRHGPRVPFVWGLWGDDFGKRPKDGSPASPYHVADEVMVAVYEF